MARILAAGVIVNPAAGFVGLTINGAVGKAGLIVNTSAGASTLTVNDNGNVTILGIPDSTANTLTIGGNSVAGQLTVSISNTNTADATDARLAFASGATGAALFIVNAANSSAYVTNGPTGAQFVARTIGAVPIIFGTNNVYRGQISGTGAWVIAVPTSGVALSVTGVGTTVPMTITATTATTPFANIINSNAAGTATATFAAVANKPGANGANPTMWLAVLINSTAFWIPLWPN